MLTVKTTGGLGSSFGGGATGSALSSGFGCQSATIAGQGRAGQGRAGQGRAGQGRAGQGRAGQGRAGQGRAGQGRAGQGRAGQGRAGQGRAGQGRAGQGRAGQGRAGQGRAGQGRGKRWERRVGEVKERRETGYSPSCEITLSFIIVYCKYKPIYKIV